MLLDQEDGEKVCRNCGHREFRIEDDGFCTLAVCCNECDTSHRIRTAR